MIRIINGATLYIIGVTIMILGLIEVGASFELTDPWAILIVLGFVMAMYGTKISLFHDKKITLKKIIGIFRD